MSAATGGTGGQASSSSQQPGQAPQANNTGSPSAEPQGQAPNGNNASSSSAPASGQQLTPAQYEAMIAELRKEAAGHRTEKTAAQTELKKFQDAQLTAEQKRDRDLADLQTKTLDQELRLQQQSLQLAGYRLGTSLGIGDIGAALALVQAEHGHEVKYAADGTPENISDLLKAVLKEHPVLAAQQTPPRPPASSGGATNPGAGARTGVITRASYAAMSQQERVARNKEVTEILRQNGGRLPD